MKKLIILAASVVLCGASLQANSTPVLTSEQSCIINMGWEDCGIVTSLKGNNITLYRLKCQLQYNSATGQYRINYQNNWYNVKYSDKSGYEYMFYYNSKPYYFNF